MSSALAQQLAQARAKAPAASLHASSKQKTRPSVLFSPTEAADYDRKTIYHLGLNGLQELVDSGARELEQFREPLFSSAVAETERDLQDSETNKALDAALDACLAALGPYLLRKPALKVLEYFVRHFEVHVRNADRLLTVALPFHDTDLFASIVALPARIERTRWAFLRPIGKSREPLTRQQLVKACLTEPALLQAAADLVDLQPESDRPPAFLAVLAAEVIFAAAQGKRHGNADPELLAEKVVPILVSPALAALRDADRPEHQRAGYIIVAQLAKHGQLSDKACRLFLLSALRKASQATLPAALQCAAVVLFFGPSDAALPDKCVNRLARKFDAGHVSSAIVEAFTASPSAGPGARLVDDLFAQLAVNTEDDVRHDELLLACLRVCTPLSVGSLFAGLASRHATIAAAGEPQNERAALLEQAAQALASARPAAIDRVLAHGADEALFAFASACFAKGAAGEADAAAPGEALVGSRPVQVGGVHTTLRLALHHTAPAVRAHALAQLLDSAGTPDLIDFAVLLDRVRDDDADVAVAALQLAAAVIGAGSPLPLREARDLVSSLDHVANTWTRKGRREVAPAVLAVLEQLQVANAANEMEVDNDADALSREALLADCALVALQFVHAETASELLPGTAAQAVSAAAAFSKANAPDSLGALFEGKLPKGKRKLDEPAAGIAARAASNDEAAKVALSLCARALQQGHARACTALAATFSRAFSDRRSEQSRKLAEMVATLCTAPLVWSSASDGRAAVLGGAIDALLGAFDPKLDATTAASLDAGTEADFPLSLRVLCTLLGAPEIGYKRVCAGPVRLLLQQYLSSPGPLRALLLIGSGAAPKVSNEAQRRALVLVTALVTALGSSSSFVEATPFLLAPLSSRSCAAVRQAAVDCARAIRESASAQSVYLGLPGAKSAVEVYPGSADKTDPEPSAGLKVLLDRVVGAAVEFDTDASTLDRLVRTMAGSEGASCVGALVDRATILARGTEVDAASSKLRFETAQRAASGFVRAVVDHAPAASIGGSTCQLARAAQDAGMHKLLALATKRWADELVEADFDVLLEGLRATPGVRAAVLRALRSPHVFAPLNAGQRSAAFDALCELVESEERGSAIAADAIRALGQVPFAGSMLRARLDKTGTDAPVVLLEAARARLFNDAEPAEGVLDLCVELVPPLFALLGKGRVELIVLASLNRALSMAKGLVEAPGKHADKALVKSLAHVDLDLVVRCVLSAVGAPVRNASLELLNTCTMLFPDKALQVVVPVLEAVGGTSGDQGMADLQESSPEGGLSPYAFVVLEHLTRCLSASSGGASRGVGSGQPKAARKGKGGSKAPGVDAIESERLVRILDMFVSSSCRSAHSSRLLQLYELLVRSATRDASCLWAVLVLLVGSGAEGPAGNNAEHQQWLAGQLLARFDVQSQVFALMKVVESLDHLLPSAAGAEARDEETDSLLPGIAACLVRNGASSFGVAQGLCGVVSAHLSSKLFIRQLRALGQQQAEAAQLQGASGFLGLLQHLHRQIHLCGTEEEAAADSEAGGSATPTAAETAQLWAALRGELCTVLDKISALLSVPMFVAVLYELMRDPDAHVRHLAVRQLSTKVSQQHARWRPEETLIFLEMVVQLRDMVESSAESEVNKQTALLSIDVLARYLGPKHPKPFAPVQASVVKCLHTAVASMRDGGAAPVALFQLASSAALCAGTLTGVLGKRSLPHLPHMAPDLLFCFKQYLSTQREPDSESALRRTTEETEARLMLAQSAASSLYALVAELPKFLSPYLSDVLLLVGAGDQEGVPDLVRATSKRIGRRVAQRVEPRLLVGPLTAAFSRFVARGQFSAASHLVGVLQISAQAMSRESLARELRGLSSFFVQALDTRALAQGSLASLDDLAALEPGLVELEEALAECYVDLVLLLSAGQMRTTFAALCDGMKASGAEADAQAAKGADLFSSITDQKPEEAQTGRKRKGAAPTEQPAGDGAVDARQGRVATLYLMTSVLADKLLSLASPFATKLLDDILGDLGHAAEPESADEQSDSDDGSGSESDSSAPGPAKKRKTAKASVANEQTGGAPGDRATSPRWRAQQRVVRERALDVLAFFCEQRRDLLVDEQGQPTKTFGDVVDAVLGGLDIDQHTLGGVEEAEEAETAEYYSEMLSEHLIPALVKLARSVGDETCWQTLHHAVLEFGKHASGHVRVGMLNTVLALFEEVGEPYIALLADTLPTVAELLEDKERSVKQVAHRVAKKLQQLSGEDLSTFLS